MKQVLITREQLNKIVAEVNADIATDLASKKKNGFIMGMLLTVHTEHVIHVVCDKLFGKEESDEEKNRLQREFTRGRLIGELSGIR